MLTGYRILIVDDHASNRDYLRELLNHFFQESTFEEASNGEHALMEVKRAMEGIYHPPFDLIFMDFMMPVMNGEQSALSIQRVLVDAGEEDAWNTMQMVTWSTSRTTPFRGTSYVLIKPTTEEDVRGLLMEMGLLT